MEDERVPITFHDRVVEAQVTERSWRLVDSTGEEVAWSVLSSRRRCCPRSGRRSSNAERMSTICSTATGCPPTPRSVDRNPAGGAGRTVAGIEDAVVKRGMDERATEELTKRYLALAEAEPELKDDLVAWFKRAEEKRLFDSLALYDLRRECGDPLPVATYNWNLEGRKTAGWKASARVQSGVSTLYENAIRAGAARAEPGPTARHPHSVRHAGQPLNADRDDWAQPPAVGALLHRDPVRRAGGHDGRLRRPGRRPSGSPPDGPSCRCSPRPRRWLGSRRAPPRRRWRRTGPERRGALLRRRGWRGERPHAVERERPIPGRRPGLESADRRGRLHARAAGPARPDLTQRGLPVAGRHVHLDRPRRRSGRAHDRRDPRTRRHRRASPRSRRWAEAEATISTADRDRRRSPGRRRRRDHRRSRKRRAAGQRRRRPRGGRRRRGRRAVRRSGNDELFGNEGDDELRGGDGNDRLVGGDGNDRFDYAVRRPSRTRRRGATPWTADRTTTGCTRVAAAEGRRTR